MNGDDAAEKPKVRLIIHREADGSIAQVTVKASYGEMTIERVLTRVSLEDWRWDLITRELERNPKLVKPVILNLIRRELKELESK